MVQCIYVKTYPNLPSTCFSNLFRLAIQCACKCYATTKNWCAVLCTKLVTTPFTLKGYRSCVSSILCALCFGRSVVHSNGVLQLQRDQQHVADTYVYVFYAWITYDLFQHILTRGIRLRKTFATNFVFFLGVLYFNSIFANIYRAKEKYKNKQNRCLVDKEDILCACSDWRCVEAGCGDLVRAQKRYVALHQSDVWKIKCGVLNVFG